MAYLVTVVALSHPRWRNMVFVTLILLVALAAPSATLRADGEATHVQPIRTAKERLGSKASDEQRVDNCKVPVDLRGPKPRSDECSSDGPSAEAKH